MLKKMIGKAFTKTLPPTNQRVVSRTEPKTGNKKALFVSEGVPVKAVLPNERFWPGRDTK